MYAVVVRNGETNNFSADYPEISQAKNNNFLLHNNYGVKIDSSGSLCFWVRYKCEIGG